MQISAIEFLKLIKAKGRQLKFTKHAINRAEKRLMQLSLCRVELCTKTPAMVQEQASEVPFERQFNVYYAQDNDKFHRYVIALNSTIRVITMMRISKNLQLSWRYK